MASGLEIELGPGGRVPLWPEGCSALAAGLGDISITDKEALFEAVLIELTSASLAEMLTALVDEIAKNSCLSSDADNSVPGGEMFMALSSVKSSSVLKIRSIWLVLDVSELLETTET